MARGKLVNYFVRRNNLTVAPFSTLLNQMVITIPPGKWILECVELGSIQSISGAVAFGTIGVQRCGAATNVMNCVQLDRQAPGMRDYPNLTVEHGDTVDGYVKVPSAKVAYQWELNVWLRRLEE